LKSVIKSHVGTKNTIFNRDFSPVKIDHIWYKKAAEFFKNKSYVSHNPQVAGQARLT
jgi:hypothetical protein